MATLSLIDLAERGWIPDGLVRVGIRRILEERLRELDVGYPEASGEALAKFLERTRAMPVALSTDAANEQHYEVPAAFFQRMLGPRLKYSSCYWPDSASDLAAAEDAMLARTCERAGLANGQRILELGCGWGSLTLWMAEHYPGARITAVSNSTGQKRHIDAECARRGFANVEVVTADMNDFSPSATYDRVVSVEMFEHMRNYGELMKRIAGWLVPGGVLFVHIFCHCEHAYFYEPSGPSDWMAREFFTGGTMPSDDLLLHFQQHLVRERRWRVGGRHYARTLEEWLLRLDNARDEALGIFAPEFGRDGAARQLQRWRLFLMACAELFAYREGREWYVSHYRFRRRDAVDQPG